MKNFITYQLAKEFYSLTLRLKPNRHLKEQLTRASLSVVLNLAEGSGRSAGGDKRRFYNIALASLRECQAALDVTPSASDELRDMADKLGAYIYNLIRSVRL